MLSASQPPPSTSFFPLFFTDPFSILSSSSPLFTFGGQGLKRVGDRDFENEGLLGGDPDNPLVITHCSPLPSFQSVLLFHPLSLILRGLFSYCLFLMALG